MLIRNIESNLVIIETCEMKWLSQLDHFKSRRNLRLLFSSHFSSPHRASPFQNSLKVFSTSSDGVYKEAFVYDTSLIRNFSIIAHIDHGKSTLADRLLQETGTIAAEDMQNQVLDNMELERERGITIKLQAARMNYKAKDGKNYLLNLIGRTDSFFHHNFSSSLLLDTPGHVDFGYEGGISVFPSLYFLQIIPLSFFSVSRSLAACEGALLVVDASQGVEAQTMANVYLALENNLEIIPVINKIDLPTADADRVKLEMENTIGLDCSDAIPCSAKLGINIDAILEAIVHKCPPPSGSSDKPLQAIIFDSYYDTFRGVIVFFRIVNGTMKKFDQIYFKNSQMSYQILELGIMTPTQHKKDILQAGEVGYLAANIKSVGDCRVGDTIVLAESFDQVPSLPGYEPAKQMVFSGIYPSDSGNYENLREAINKLKLNDAALSFEPEVSSAMGFGFRCGFLGLLHMDIVQERLEREYKLDLVVTAPSVIYKIVTYDDVEVLIHSPSKCPDAHTYKEILEPYVKLEIISPSEYTGAIMDALKDRRGNFLELKYLTPSRVIFIYEVGKV